MEVNNFAILLIDVTFYLFNVFKSWYLLYFLINNLEHIIDEAYNL